MKSYGVTIQMKPLQQYFCMVPFVFLYFRRFFFGGGVDFLSLMRRQQTYTDIQYDDYTVY